MTQRRPAAGHFAGIQFFHDKIDVARWSWRLPSPAATSVAIEMEHLETVHSARAIAMGADLRRGSGVESFDQSDDDVIIRTSSRIFRGRWLVGCDGGRSTVRKVGGFAFTGTDPEFTGYSVQIDMADPGHA